MDLQETKGVPTSEFSQPFVQGMLDRMGMSFFKYGAVAEAYPHRVNAIESALIRIAKYMGLNSFKIAVARVVGKLEYDSELVKDLGGNTEFLMDAGNFVMIEFMRPLHPLAYFKSTDSHESPGRAHTSGEISQSANTTGRENVRRGGSNLITSGGFYKREGD